MGHSKPIHDVVKDALAELGIATSSLWRSILIRDVRYEGERYHFDGGHALWLPETNLVEIYDDNGGLLKTVGVDVPEQRAA